MAEGETDIALRNGQRTLSVINKYGVRNFWVLSSGGHEWRNWRRYLHQTAQIMFPAPAGNATRTPADSSRQGVAGRWHAEFESPVGPQKYDYEFKVDGEKLTGKATGQIGDQKRDPVDIQDGKVKGDDVSFVETVHFMDMDITVKYTGKLVGDEIRFKREVGDFATEDVVARRVKVDGATDR